MFGLRNLRYGVKTHRHAALVVGRAADVGRVGKRLRRFLRLVRIGFDNHRFRLRRRHAGEQAEDRQQKKEFIGDVRGQVFDRAIIKFIKLLIDKGRISELKGILEQYIAQANQALGIQTAVVYSARELSESDRKKLQDALEKKHKCKIILENKIDPSVIAGIKVIVGNEVTDVTVKNRLDEMKGILLKGGLA